MKRIESQKEPKTRVQRKTNRDCRVEGPRRSKRQAVATTPNPSLPGRGIALLTAES
jgi:hypothetical protein